MTEAAEYRFSDSYITENPQRSLEELTKALEEKSDDAESFSQRAYAHILLQNYNDAVLDAKRSLELQPNNANAFLRMGEAEFYLKNYSAAQDTFKQGQRLNSSSSFLSWIKLCEEKLKCSSCPVPQSTNTGQKFRHDWYQTESQVIVTVMIKNVPKEDVHMQFAERQFSLNVNLPSGEHYNLTLYLFHSIVPEQSTFKVLSTKIEIKMKKTEALRWDKLEGQPEPHVKQFTPEFMNKYPSSSHYTKNWDKLVVEIKEEEKNEKLEGDAALNHLFQQIYTDGSDEVKRAMNKSFTESGGTVLSTNWLDVGKRKVDVNPPEDMEYKKF
ncbi:protein SGT1 homolog [Hyla sarda]|uniref:protein SGT1 homolog n=1 Tax=Hyla sarda TaxID=327740 RepID=UPI0024C430C4|nr:protein SGT1 homolog [Hyla sarda]XP_056411451.1 protein SGT1 homolog [Hyla sarda]